MKILKTLTCIIILSLTFAQYSEAKGRSFGGGFRSQRTAPAPMRSAPTPAKPAVPAKSTFGSFGEKPTATAAGPQNAQPQNVQPSTMSKDLNTNTTQANALKTYDARNKINEPVAGAATAAGTTNSGWFRSGNQGAATPNNAINSAPQPAVIRQGGGFMNNAMWFMLGSSMASNHQRHTQQPAEQNGQVINPAEANDSSIVSPVEEKESFLLSALRFILWAGIIFGLYMLFKNIFSVKKSNTNAKPNYTFGN